MNLTSPLKDPKADSKVKEKLANTAAKSNNDANFRQMMEIISALKEELDDIAEMSRTRLESVTAAGSQSAEATYRKVMMELDPVR